MKKFYCIKPCVSRLFVFVFEGREKNLLNF